MWVRSFTIFRVHKYSIQFLCFHWLNYVIAYFFSNFFWLIQRINNLISFNKISELLPAFTCARAIGNLCCICLGSIDLFLIFFIVSDWYFSLCFGFPDVVSFKFDLILFWFSSAFCNDILPFFIYLKIFNGPLNLTKFIWAIFELLK